MWTDSRQPAQNRFAIQKLDWYKFHNYLLTTHVGKMKEDERGSRWEHPHCRMIEPQSVRSQSWKYHSSSSLDRSKFGRLKFGPQILLLVDASDMLSNGYMTMDTFHWKPCRCSPMDTSKRPTNYVEHANQEALPSSGSQAWGEQNPA